MKTTIRFFLSVFTLSFALAFVGCGDDTTNGSGGDMAMTVVHDLATGTVQDLATETGDGGLKPLAATCTVNGDCASNYCGSYMMGNKHLCTFMCTSGQAAPQCTSPGNGQCNNMNECQFPNM
jgi:hypothetical protein